ncbi:hypothetical protein [Parabacteroides sp. PF5-9]|uniref:HAAS signaling domain-containing protein n=1 Tax=Parabacteroides sp. PF5-9 TaxID=1742404 RepID=UPI0024751D2A|nr:hypothetical protein [Parabacteroides sp. PF5-9]MDH6356546.1 putative membrane protein [Parabacteroides sp. PF5-9]
MKNIELSDKNAALLYDKYIEDVKRIINILSKKDQDDILMEINSHIYESMQRKTSDSEIDKIRETLDKLGDPYKSFATLVADRKLLQATRTFNPLHVIKGLSLNLSNGFIYILFSILYLFLFCFIFLIFAEIVYPHNTGLFIGENETHFGFIANITDSSLTEVLGNWFIPIVFFAMVSIYLIVTLLLKLKYKFSHKK